MAVTEMQTALNDEPTLAVPRVAVPAGGGQLTRIRAILGMAVTGITSNKGRTLLTLLGVVIGVASVITAVGIGTATSASVSAQIASLGTNLLQIQPGASFAGGVRGGAGSASTLTYSDAQAIAEQSTPDGATPDVASVAPEDSTTVQAVAGNNNTSTTADGVTPEILGARNYQVAQGAFISADDVQHASQVADLGASVVSTLFPVNPASAIGSDVLLNGQSYQVIGIMVSKGGGGGRNQDDTIFVPITAVQERLATRAGAANAVTGINVVATRQDTVNQAQAEVDSLLRALHKLTPTAPDDFSFFSQTSVQQTASNVTGLLTLLLGAVAAASLLVGGIGIMNIMLVTVTERTREIGLRKAVGARRGDILMQFLTESTMISVLGGVVGVGLSYVLAALLPALGENVLISNTSIVLAVGVSLAIGLFFGSYPASRAAALDPIQALRYE